MYCIKMKRPEEELWNSRLSKVLTLIDMYADELQVKTAALNNTDYESKYFKPKTEVKIIKSMKEIPGW